MSILSRLFGPRTPPPPPPVQITYKKKGTIVIHATIVVRDEDGREMIQPANQKPLPKLCGCGKSEIPPFCDGSHKTAGRG